MIKFTLATCVYNSAAELPATLQSVMGQGYPHIEHLIIDGASSDGSLALAENYKRESDALSNGHEIRIVSEKDGGLYDAMNKALRLAKGDFILFLNAGDRLHGATTLDLVAQAVGGRPTGIIFGDTDIVNGAGQFVRHRRLKPHAELGWKDFRRGMLVCHQAFFASTALTANCPYNLKYRFSADFDWCIRIMRQAQEQNLPIVNAKTIVADYLEGGMTVKNHRKSLLERLRIMGHHYGWPTAAAMHLWFVARAVIKK